MKKSLLIMLMAAAGFTASAQPGTPRVRMTVEERVANVHHKVDSTFKPDAAKLTKIDAVFTKYYTSTDKVREELMSGGERPDMQVMREKMTPITEARDAELKTIFTEDEYKKFKDELEPVLMPRRAGGNGGGGGGNRPSSKAVSKPLQTPCFLIQENPLGG